MMFPVSPEARHLAATHLWASRRSAIQRGVSAQVRAGHAKRLAAVGILMESSSVRRERVRDELETLAERWGRDNGYGRA